MHDLSVRISAICATVIAVLVASLVVALPAGADEGTATVSGALTLDAYGNLMNIDAYSTGGGSAEGHAVLQSGARGLHNFSAPEVIRIRITCLRLLSSSTVAVGGATVGATVGVGTVWPYYTFVLEDRGPGLPDKWTMWAQYPPFSGGSQCNDVWAPAVETSVHGNIVIGSR
jgi:hypothetical protein